MSAHIEPSDLWIGRRVRDFVVCAVVGDVPQGRLYRAERISRECSAALLVIRTDVARGAVAPERLLREAAEAVRASHVGIAGILDAGETEEGLLYVAMAYERRPKRRAARIGTRTLAKGTSEQVQRMLAEAAALVGRPAAAAEHYRAALAAAIRRGDLEEIATLYNDLATALYRDGDTVSAAVELREAIDLVTGGAGARADRAPRGLWKLLLFLAQIERAAHHTAEAREAAMFAARHAVRAGALDGAARALGLVRSLARQ
jgi:hypothetical protein